MSDPNLELPDILSDRMENIFLRLVVPYVDATWPILLAGICRTCKSQLYQFLFLGCFTENIWRYKYFCYHKRCLTFHRILFSLENCLNELFGFHVLCDLNCGNSSKQNTIKIREKNSSHKLRQWTKSKHVWILVNKFTVVCNCFRGLFCGMG